MILLHRLSVLFIWSIGTSQGIIQPHFNFVAVDTSVFQTRTFLLYNPLLGRKKLVTVA
jgi:hypothetical protein